MANVLAHNPASRAAKDIADKKNVQKQLQRSGVRDQRSGKNLPEQVYCQSDEFITSVLPFLIQGVVGRTASVFDR
jgi:hypothetical protein